MEKFGYNTLAMVSSIRQWRVVQPFRPAYRALRRWAQNLPARVNRDLILVAAHPRSGSTAVATLLARHTGLRAFTETGPWTREFDAAVYTGQVHFSRVLHKYRYEFSHDLMSAADATCILPQMKAALPGMRTVYVVRDPRDTICSLVERINNYDLSTFEVRDPRFRWLDVDWLIHDESNPHRKLARRWCLFLDIATSIEDVFYFRYEDFCSDKPRCISHIADRLGLRHAVSTVEGWDEQYSKHDRRPIHGPGRWRKMMPAPIARDVEAICRSYMERFGYR